MNERNLTRIVGIALVIAAIAVLFFIVLNAGPYSRGVYIFD